MPGGAIFGCERQSTFAAEVARRAVDCRRLFLHVTVINRIRRGSLWPSSKSLRSAVVRIVLRKGEKS